jgi:hypothetical protein
VTVRKINDKSSVNLKFLPWLHVLFGLNQSKIGPLKYKIAGTSVVRLHVKHTVFIFIVAPCIVAPCSLKSKTGQSPTNALFITLGRFKFYTRIHTNISPTFLLLHRAFYLNLPRKTNKCTNTFCILKTHTKTLKSPYMFRSTTIFRELVLSLDP